MKQIMNRKQWDLAFLCAVIAVVFLVPEYSFGSLESSLVEIKSKVTGVILPLISVIGLAIAAMSFYSGNPQAKQHIIYSIIGCIFGFGAQAIVDFISQTVR